MNLQEPTAFRRFRRRRLASLHLRCRTRDRRKAAPGAVVAIAVVRNEALRLPRFLDHYRGLGVGKFFIVENNSTDDTAQLLAGQDDVCLYQTPASFERKESWIDLLLRRHAGERWCVVADADELLDFPESGRLGLPGLCAYMDSRGFNALHAVLLDLYPEGFLDDVAYAAGEDYFSRAWYFDPPENMVKVPRVFGEGAGLDHRLAGGVRERVFGVRNCCSKFPLIRRSGGVFLHDGQHHIERARIADIRAVLYHFKYLQDFKPRVAEESERGEHWNGAEEYKQYARVTESRGGGFQLRCEESVLFTGPEQMEALGVTLRSVELGDFAGMWETRKAP
ncbi:MAG: glycosyltransferase family 2 protein [Chthoniobacterales bacterium]|nr:glycosyltransferase family 2 protein [Chthoniobacterales bacterium]